MEAGRIRVGLSMMGSYIRASHDVEPDQREPGIPAAEQPAEHVLDIGMMQWDLDAQIGLHHRFALEVLVPIRATVIDATFNDFDGNEKPGFSSIHHRDETIAGLADVTLTGRIGLVTPMDVPRWNLALRLGLSQPTGNIEPDPFALGAEGREHQHMFFGSGTYDPVMGLDSNLALGKWSLVSWVVGKTPVYANRFGYRGSAMVAGGVGAQSRFGLERWVFMAQPELYFETPAEWSGVDARNSGRLSLIATAGVFVLPAPGWQVHALLKAPYYTISKGGQLRWPIVGVLGFSYMFEMLERDHKH